MNDVTTLEKPSVQEKLDLLKNEIKILADSLGCNILYAVHFPDEGKAAVHYEGLDDIVIQYGLQKALTQD